MGGLLAQSKRGVFNHLAQQSRQLQTCGLHQCLTIFGLGQCGIAHRPSGVVVLHVPTLFGAAPVAQDGVMRGLVLCR